jgi:hypothetical protein
MDDAPINGSWTIHICEDHRVQDCVLCGVFDVVTVVDKRWLDNAIDERNQLADELEALA